MHALYRTVAVSGTGQVPALLSYDTTDPYAVTIVFADEPWLFARELLADGMVGSVGQGDVRVTRLNDQVAVTLVGETRQLTMHLDAADVEEFLTSTFHLVPEGAESAPVDEWLASLQR